MNNIGIFPITLINLQKHKLNASLIPPLSPFIIYNYAIQQSIADKYNTAFRISGIILNYLNFCFAFEEV